MLTTTNVNIRMDTKEKIEFEKIVNNLGVSMSTAFNMFAKAVVREERIPFAISLKKEEPYDPEYIAATLKSIEQYKCGKLISFGSVEEAEAEAQRINEQRRMANAN